MLSLLSSEVKTVKVWSEKGESSPFPQETAVLKRLKANASDRPMMFSSKELRVILHWAEQEIKRHRGGEQYILEHEEKLIKKIEAFIADQDEKSFGFMD